MITAIVPKFKHDCDTCRFVGRLKGYDCYTHETQDHGMVTYVARISDREDDYLSRSYFPKRGIGPEYDDGIWYIIGEMGK